MKIIWPKLIGIFFFILFLALLNFLVQYITFDSFVSFTGFFNRNSVLIVGIVIVFLFSELVSSAKFPANVLSPLLSFSGAWMLLVFVYNFLESLNRRFEIYILEIILLIRTPVFISVLSLTFIFGYLPIIYKLLKEKNKGESISEESVEKIKVIEKIVEKDSSKKKKRKKK